MPLPEHSHHPVWALYDELRTAKFNEFCYQDKLQEIKNWNLFIEITLAITAPGSAIAGLFFWENPFGQWAWKILIIIAAIVSVIKPFLKLSEKIETAADVIKGYADYYIRLQKVKNQVEYEKKYTQEHHQEYLKILDMKKPISDKEVIFKLSQKIKDKARQKVLKLLPTGQFFVPEDV